MSVQFEMHRDLRENGGRGKDCGNIDIYESKQVEALEKDIFLLEPCMCVCDHIHKCIGAWLGPSVWQYRLTYCPWRSGCCCLCSGLTDGEWVWVTALWQSDESPAPL